MVGLEQRNLIKNNITFKTFVLLNLDKNAFYKVVRVSSGVVTWWVGSPANARLVSPAIRAK